MKTFLTPQQRSPTESVVAIGSFDGVHLGHQALLAQLKAKAREYRLPSVVYTFDPPTRVLMQGVEFLSTLPEKLELLQRYGIDETVAVSFTPEFAARPKEAFLNDLQLLHPKTIVVGEDFYFGKGRTGGVSDLRERWEVVALPMHQLGGEDIKSTRVRALLAEGQVEQAARLLGRHYEASGVVVRGDQLGRTLGYPTANICVPDGKTLPKGVFAVRVMVRQQEYAGMANVGMRPTLHSRQAGSQSASNQPVSSQQGAETEATAPTLERRFEVHLFDLPAERQDLYGQDLQVQFVQYLRPEQRFAGLEQLKAQLHADALHAQQALAGR